MLIFIQFFHLVQAFFNLMYEKMVSQFCQQVLPKSIAEVPRNVWHLLITLLQFSVQFKALISFLFTEVVVDFCTITLPAPYLIADSHTQ